MNNIQPVTPISVDNIKNKIHVIRGQKVMLDRDLAELYQVETKVLNQAVKRNIKRFPEDFMFQLTKEELDNLKSQFVTSSWGGVRKLPYAFTEQGLAMRKCRAENVSGTKASGIQNRKIISIEFHHNCQKMTLIF